MVAAGPASRLALPGLEGLVAGTRRSGTFTSSGGGCWDRTSDLRDMGPSRYHCANPLEITEAVYTMPTLDKLWLGVILLIWINE